MSFNKFISLFLIKIYLINFSTVAQPLVILEYSKDNNYNTSEASDYTNENFSSYHKVRKNETLSEHIRKSKHKQEEY